MFDKQKQLFRIISTLIPSEKSYFKKYCYKNASKDNEVIYLFDLIEKHLKKDSEIDETILKHKLTKKYSFKNYTKTKSKLLQLLLETIRDYDKKNNELERVFEYIAFSDSLIERKLFHDSKNMLEKALKIAEELEQIEQIIYIKSKIARYSYHTEKYTASKKIDDNKTPILDKIELLKQKIIDENAIYQVVHFQKTIGVPRSQDDIELFKEIIGLESFNKDYEAKLMSSKLSLATIKSNFMIGVGDTNTAIDTATKLIDNFSISSRLQKNINASYITLFDTLMQASLLSLNILVFEKYYPKFLAIRTFSSKDENIKLEVDLYARSIYYIVTDKVELYKELIPEFEVLREKPFIHNVRKISLAYYMVMGSFLAEEYENAYKNIQWLKNHKHLGIRYDIEVAILTMESIILLEQREFSLLEYQLRSFYEYLKNRERKFQIETALLSFIKNGIKAKSKEEIFSNISSTYSEMEKIIKENPSEKAFLNSFDIVSWLQSKIENESFKKLYYKNNIG